MKDVLRWNGKIDNKNLGGKQMQLRVNTKYEKATLGDLFGICKSIFLIKGKKQYDQ